ncbi:MAG TPA: pyruvate ferredoxin oxidoreductase [Bacteroidia bacterium]|nr:pyruvate ferredoxin oxidoreductase [Bacteroidia bacterium]
MKTEVAILIPKRKEIKRHTKKVLKGNSAAAEAAKICRATFVTAYPITPQTTIVEEIASMIARKEFDATSVNMESEHSVFAALKGAALTGKRVFTATSGQGLLYAHEVLHAIAHLRLPIVACNVGRPSYPWNIWCDQSDSIAQRDTGWIQFYCENSQEVLDTIIQSYKISEHLLLPTLVVLDAFYVSHTNENVFIPEQKLVDEYLPSRKKSDSDIDIDNPKSFGGLVAPDMYDKFNRLFWEDMNKVEDETIKAGEEFEKYFGRKYAAVEAANIHSGTKIILITLSSITTTARGVIQSHPEVGLLKIRLLKPFPKKSILKILKKVNGACILVTVDRNFLGDNEGALMQEMKRALYGRTGKIFGVYAGLGGRDVPPSTIEKIISIDFNSAETKEIIWIDK